MSDLHRLTMSELSRLIHDREVTPTELVEESLARIERMDPNLKAWESVDAVRARATAAKLTGEATNGQVRGPLHGIPVGVKDVYFTAGLQTSMGSRLHRDLVPEMDATIVARLRQAGAVILGKTVTTEFASSDPPPTRNPWHAEHTPGGSSSGSAVAVATGMCTVATGSQTAGSVNRPAAYNGVVGLKPTFGRVSRFGLFPLSWSLDTAGWITRGVRDAAVLLDLLSGHDPKDPGSANRPGTSATIAVDLEDPAWTPRIGVVLGMFAHRASLELKAHAHQIIQALDAAGAEVDFFDLPDSAVGMNEAQQIIAAAECGAIHRQPLIRHGDQYGPNIRAAIEAGTVLPAGAYLQAQRLRRRFRADMEASLAMSHDVLLMPAIHEPAPRDLSTTGDPMFQAPWTASGLPVLNLPTGLSRSGLPIGIQLVARGWNEETLLRAGRWIELTVNTELGEPGGASGSS